MLVIIFFLDEVEFCCWSWVFCVVFVLFLVIGSGVVWVYMVLVNEFRVCLFEVNFVFDLMQFNVFFGMEVSFGYVVGGGQFVEGDVVMISFVMEQFMVQVFIVLLFLVGMMVQIFGQGMNFQLVGDLVFFVQNFNVISCGDQEIVEVLQQIYVVQEGDEVIVGVWLSEVFVIDVVVWVGFFEDMVMEGVDYQMGLFFKGV